MGSLESRLGAMEEALVDELIHELILELMVEAEIREMLAVLEASEDIEQPLYEKVARIITTAKDERWPG